MIERVRPGDVAIVCLIALFAWLGLRVHDSIAGLADMAQGMQDTGTSLQRSGATAAREVRTGVGEAADAADQLPIVGAQLSAGLRDAAERTASSLEREAGATGAELVESGRQGEEDARETAWLLGWLAFLIPTVALLAQAVPHWLGRRAAQTRPGLRG